MKRIIILMALLLVASVSVSAATLAFSQGAAFVSVANSDWPLAVGSSTQIMWFVDDLGYGIKNESAELVQYGFSGGPNPRFRSQNINEVQIEKFLSKSVAVGLGFGTHRLETMSMTFVSPVVEINGAIQILSGKGEKIAASLDFGIAQRWIKMSDTIYSTNQSDMNQTVSTLAVTIGL